MAAGNAAVTQLVQRLDPANQDADTRMAAAAIGPALGGNAAGGSVGAALPADWAAADAIIPITTFIADVEEVERANPTDTPQEILSRIRVTWYSGLAFDLLIPGARTADLPPSGPTLRPWPGRWPMPRGLGPISPAARRQLTGHANENGIADNPSPYIGLPQGEHIDIGHVFLVADALLHPETNLPYTRYDVPNIDPASWVADVGIASVWLTKAEEGKPDGRAPSNPTPPSADAYWHMSAPDADLLGDVDGFALKGQIYDHPEQRLSASLRAYYLGEAASATGLSHRFQIFCAANGLTYRVAGGTVTWDTAWRAPTIERIDRFNTLYAAGDVGAVWGTLLGPTPHTWPHTAAMLDRFLNWLKPRLEAELHATATR